MRVLVLSREDSWHWYRMAALGAAMAVHAGVTFLLVSRGVEESPRLLTVADFSLVALPEPAPPSARPVPAVEAPPPVPPEVAAPLPEPAPPEPQAVMPEAPVIPAPVSVPRPQPKKKPPAPPKKAAVPQPATDAAVASGPPPSAPAAPDRGGEAQAFTPARVDAAYLSNPRPTYPAVARRMGWEGVVTLGVMVTAAGEAREVLVRRSSGHEILDQSAVEAVRSWRFIAARRGGVAVAANLEVPVRFSLRERG